MTHDRVSLSEELVVFDVDRELSPWYRVVVSSHVSRLRRVLRRGFGLRSLVILGVIGAMYGVIGLFFPFLIDWDAEPDVLLTFIWTVMTASLLYSPELVRDGKLMAVGLVGGLVIEGWGTSTLLWTYFTEERPPLWILPAWPIAAVCIDRFVRLTQHLAPWMRSWAQPTGLWSQDSSSPSRG